MQRAGTLAALVVGLAAHPVARAEVAIGPADHVEAVQSRAWSKRGNLALTPAVSYAFNDPFVERGGVALRGTVWPRALVGVTFDFGAWAQVPSEASRIAQRELRARLRPTASFLVALGGVELAPADGKIAFLGSIVPFELLLRFNAGAASVSDEIDSRFSLALGAGLGARWFTSSAFGLETALTWRSAAAARSLNGRDTSGREAVYALEIGLPLRFGGGS